MTASSSGQRTRNGSQQGVYATASRESRSDWSRTARVPILSSLGGVPEDDALVMAKQIRRRCVCHHVPGTGALCLDGNGQLSRRERADRLRASGGEWRYLDDAP